MKTGCSFVVMILSLVTLAISSCALRETAQPDFPDVSVPQDTLNKVIKLEVLPQFKNSNENNSIIAFHVKNLSTKTVIFHVSSGISIYSRDGNEWVSVQNKMQYSNEITILPPDSEAPLGIVIGIYPSIDNLTKAQEIKIVLVGSYEDAPSEIVGADININLLP